MVLFTLKVVLKVLKGYYSRKGSLFHPINAKSKRKIAYLHLIYTKGQFSRHIFIAVAPPTRQNLKHTFFTRFLKYPIFFTKSRQLLLLLFQS